jgi:hypothetical protein
MDPERLARFRRFAKRFRRDPNHVDPDAYGACEVVELLADRDYHAHAWNVLCAAVVGVLDLGSEDGESERSDPASARGLADALRGFRRDYLTETTGLISNANAVREQHAARIDRLLGEIERLRARVTVIASDVAGIQPSQVVAYMRATGWVLERVVPTHWYIMYRGCHGMDVPAMVDAPDYTTVLARMVNDLSKIEGRPGLDIVDAIRATEATP